MPVTLNHLKGQGVLRGDYVEIRNRLDCDDGFGAYEPHHVFSYSHNDTRFQEAMSYYFGDSYQEHIQQSGYLEAPQPVKIFAHCEMGDGAYFARGYDSKKNLIENLLGDSIKTPGAFYADDASVITHELQHETTSTTTRHPTT